MARRCIQCRRPDDDRRAPAPAQLRPARRIRRRRRLRRARRGPPRVPARLRSAACGLRSGNQLREWPMSTALRRLDAHPFSSYSQKALIALYENGTPFDYRNLEDPAANVELTALWPMRRFPILVDGERVVLEASCVVEYLDLHYPGPVRLVPQDPKVALEVRMLDRFFDNYISTPQQKCVFDRIRKVEDR